MVFGPQGMDVADYIAVTRSDFLIRYSACATVLRNFSQLSQCTPAGESRRVAETTASVAVQRSIFPLRNRALPSGEESSEPHGRRSQYVFDALPSYDHRLVR